jgi:hypothetical protein
MCGNVCTRDGKNNNSERLRGAQIQREIGSHAHAIVGVKDGKVVGSRDARRVPRSAPLQL